MCFVCCLLDYARFFDVASFFLASASLLFVSFTITRPLSLCTLNHELLYTGVTSAPRECENVQSTNGDVENLTNKHLLVGGDAAPKHAGILCSKKQTLRRTHIVEHGN